MLKPITLHIHGRLTADPDNKEQKALLLLDVTPQEETAVSLYLRFPFVTLGPEEHIFPSYILDDWAKEIRGTAVYDWMVDNGDHFPRAEVFGFEQDGSETQCFVRGLEHYVKLPCYVYPSLQAQVNDGVLVRKILVVDTAVFQPERNQRPSLLERPLVSARVQWWRVPPVTV